jgi:ribosome-associated protein YbcJ (S4-like RNA binding protein)
MTTTKSKHVEFRHLDAHAISDTRVYIDDADEDKPKCRICNENPVWLRGECHDCFVETSN